MFSLYIHIPYCSAICPYCDFNVYAVDPRPETRYVDALLGEMSHAAAEAPWRGDSVQTIYLGGGTPSLFEPESIRRILGGVYDRWAVEPAVEVTLEATPESVTAERFAAYRDAGVNRVSVGLQSMHATHLARLGRLHGPEDNHRAFAAARTAGLDNISLDLIFAVPGQTLAEWEADLRTVAALSPEHVSAYNLTYEERTPFFRWRARGTIQPAGEDDEEAMFALARDILPAAGLEAYEISSFARSGYRSRHNGNYWNGTSYLGIGAGAHSYVGEGWGRRWWNERDHRGYMATVERRGLARAETEELTREQAMTEFVFLGLRRAEGIDTTVFAARFGEGFEARFATVPDLCAEGLLEATAAGYHLSRKGLLLADSLFALFV